MTREQILGDLAEFDCRPALKYEIADMIIERERIARVETAERIAEYVCDNISRPALILLFINQIISENTKKGEVNQ